MSEELKQIRLIRAEIAELRDLIYAMLEKQYIDLDALLEAAAKVDDPSRYQLAFPERVLTPKRSKQE